MRGVILAAGSGSRLSVQYGRRHKVLLRVGGRAIIDYTLEAFAKVGVTDLAVIIGYEGDAVRQWVGDGSRQGLHVQYVTNPEYLRGNALSLYAARVFTGDDPFLLSMADHMVSEGLLSQLLDVDYEVNGLAVDFTPSPREVDEGTRVLVDPEGIVTHIGKDLSFWNGIDAGVFLLNPAVFEGLAELLAEERDEYQISSAITRMIQLGHPLHARDVSGAFWQDIDTLEDLRFVRQSLAVEDRGLSA